MLAATTGTTATAATAKPPPLQSPAGKRKAAATAADAAQPGSGEGCGGSDCPATVKRQDANKRKASSTASHKKGASRRADDDYIDMAGEEEEDEEEEDDDGGVGGVAPQKLAVGSRIAMQSGGSFSAFLRVSQGNGERGRGELGCGVRRPVISSLSRHYAGCTCNREGQLRVTFGVFLSFGVSFGVPSPGIMPIYAGCA